MKQHQQANTLVIVLVIVTALMTFVAAAMQFTQGIGRHAHRERTIVTAEAIGDGCFDLIFASWRQICQRGAQPVMPTGASDTNGTYSTPYLYFYTMDSPPETNAFANIPLPTAAMFPNIPGFSVTRGPITAANETISNYMVQAVDPRITLTTTDPPLSDIPPTRFPPAETPDGTNGGQMYGDRSWYYLASADITLPTPAGPVTRKMRRVFQKKIRKPFSYFMFFNDDLELHPNSTAPLTLYGQIHTNGTLYTGTSSLTLDATIPALTTGLYSGFTGPVRTQGVSYGDNWVRGFKPGDPVHTGAPAAPTLAASPAPQPSPQRVPKEFLYGILPTDFNATDANTNNDSWHELLELPTASTPDPFSRRMGANYNSFYNCGTPPTISSTPGTASPSWAIDRFPTRAHLIIEISATNVVTIKNKCGETLVSSTSTAPPPSKGPTTLTDTYNPGYWDYAWAVDMWMTALGVPSPNLNGANVGKIGRTLAGVGKTTIGSKIITTVTTTSPYNFLNGPPTSSNAPSSDIGMYVTGAGIPAYNTITGFPTTTVTGTSAGRIDVSSTASWSASATGAIQVVNTAGVSQIVTYTGKTATRFSGCSAWTGTISAGSMVSSATEATMGPLAATSTSSSVPFTITPIATITDPREAAPVELITLDFNVFKWWDPHMPFIYAGGSSYPPIPDIRRLQIFYGVIHAGNGHLPNVFIQVAQGATKKAIRIKNGATLEQKNHELAPGVVPTPTPVPSKVPIHVLTTDAPLYIQGDFGSWSRQTIAIGKTINSPNITSAGLFTTAMVGLPIAGTGPAPNYGTNGIPPFTTILSVTNASNAVMSQNATNATAVSIDLPNTAVDPPSNTTAGPRTTVANVTYFAGGGPTLIADAVTVLSNNWQDKNSALALSSRIASNTTVNAQIITGNVPTTSSAYSGGGENLLRLLEDWTGKYFTFSGSLSQYYHSKVATGTWGKANVYIEPTPSAGIGGRFWYPEPAHITGVNANIWTGVVSYSKNAWTPVPIP